MTTTGHTRLRPTGHSNIQNTRTSPPINNSKIMKKR